MDKFAGRKNPIIFTPKILVCGALKSALWKISFFPQQNESRYYDNSKPICHFLANLFLFLQRNAYVSAGYGMLASLDLIFAFLDITVCSKLAKIQIG